MYIYIYIYIDNNDMVAPVICRDTRFSWKKLADTIPQLSKQSILRLLKHMFGREAIRPPNQLRSQPLPPPVSSRTRSHGSPDDPSQSSELP